MKIVEEVSYWRELDLHSTEGLLAPWRIGNKFAIKSQFSHYIISDYLLKCKFLCCETSEKKVYILNSVLAPKSN